MDRSFVFAKVVDAMWNHCAIATAAAIVVVDDRRILSVCHSGSEEIPKHFLLLCVDTDNRFACFEELFFDLSYLFELSVAIGMLSHRSLLLRFATSIAMLPQKRRHKVLANRRAKFF